MSFVYRRDDVPDDMPASTPDPIFEAMKQCFICGKTFDEIVDDDVCAECLDRVLGLLEEQL